MMIDIFRNWLKRYWWAWLSAVVLALLMVICWKWLGNHSDTLRNLALVIFAPLGLALATWRSIIADKNTQIADRNSLIAEDNSITDAFTRAIEQLGSGLDDKPNIEVRLGAIYALERLSKKNDDYYQAIIDILASYVRNNAPIPDKVERKPTDSTRIDIQTALTVLGRREVRPGELGLNLNNVYLPRVNLIKAKLQGAILNSSNLGLANLESADLQDAYLFSTELQGAFLRSANLQGAILNRSELQGANLKDAELQGAHLSHAELQCARLTGANLQGARLKGTDLRDADLEEAKGLNCEQLKRAKNWQLAHRDEELACGAEIPEIPF